MPFPFSIVFWFKKIMFLAPPIKIVLKYAEKHFTCDPTKKQLGDLISGSRNSTEEYDITTSIATYACFRTHRLTRFVFKRQTQTWNNVLFLQLVSRSIMVICGLIRLCLPHVQHRP